MPTPITFTLTDAGLNAALDANANGLTISLTQIAIGSGKYTPLASRTALQTELARYPLSGGDIEPNSKTLRFSAVIESATTRQAFEVGLFTSTGVLFAVASITGANPLILITANIAFVAAFGMVVSEIPAGSLTVVTDPNAPLAIALINQHLAAANPHAQYAMQAAFDDHIIEYDAHVVQNALEHANLLSLITAEAVIRDISATESVRGLVRLATESETATGTSESLATHPKGVRALVDAYRLIGGISNVDTLKIPIVREDTGNASSIALKYGELFVASGETVAYPDGAFSNATHVVIACQTASSGTLFNVSVGGQTATGFVVWHSHSSPISIAYFAIGY